MILQSLLDAYQYIMISACKTFHCQTFILMSMIETGIILCGNEYSLTINWYLSCVYITPVLNFANTAGIAGKENGCTAKDKLCMQTLQ